MSIYAIKEKTEARAELCKQMQANDARIKQANNGIYSAEELTIQKRMFSEYEKLGTEIESLETSAKVNELSASPSKLDGFKVAAPGQKFSAKDRDLAFRGWMGHEGMAEQEAAYRMGLNNKHMTFGTANNSTLTGQLGDDLVQTVVQNQIVVALKQFGGIRNLCTIYRTEKGNPLTLPVDDPTGNLATQVNQDDNSLTVTEEDFGTVTLNAYKFRSKVGLTRELIQDSVVDITAYATTRLGERMARGTENAYARGSGSSAPTGVIGAGSTLPVAVNCQHLTPNYTELVTALNAVDAEYQKDDSFAWMMHQTWHANLMFVTDPANHYIFVPAAFQGITQTMPARLLGYPIYINNLLDAPGLNKFPCVFGAWKYFVIRDSAELDFQVNPYEAMNRDVVNLYLTMRTDCNLVCASTTYPLQVIKTGSSS